MTSRAPSDLVCVAAIATAHGVRGALRLRCFTERSEDATAFGPVFDRHGRERFQLTLVGHAKGGVIATAPGIDDRDQALALKGLELYVPRARLPEPGEDEFYVSDLEGLTVEGADGRAIGEVRRVDNYGAGDVIEIRTADGRLLDLPFDRETIPVVDLAGRRLVVALPEGLLGGGGP